MVKRATEGADLAALVKMAIAICQAAQGQCPRTGPGRPPHYDDWKIAVLIIIAILHKRKSKSSQYRFLKQRMADLKEWLDLKRFPSRSTYFERYRRAHKLYQVAIELQGRQALAEGVGDATTVAVDQSKVKGLGPKWHKQDREAHRIPKGLHGVDRYATWGYSQHHGWIQGYSYEVVVTATAGTTILPVLASTDTASVSEHETFGPKIAHLPEETAYVLGDAGYDNNAYGERVEYDENGRRRGWRFVGPANPRGHGSPRATPKKPKTTKQRSEERTRQRRAKRMAYYRSAKGKRVYAQRGKTIEPYNEWFKDLFELDQAWHRGLDNNRTQILCATFCYQLLLRYNKRCGHENGQIRWILDTL